MWQQYTYTDLEGNHLYWVYTPTNYHNGKAIPLVVMLHSCTQTAADLATGTQMNQLAERNGFVVVYPQQTRSSHQQRCWNWFDPAHQARGHGEPARIAGIVHTLQQDTLHWTIDPQRIYVAGHSAGAAMTVILGASYPDLFAAIGVHSGLEYQAAHMVNQALNAMFLGGPDPIQQGNAAYNTMGSFARVVPTIIFHGTNDTTVSPINGDQTVQQWMHTNRLASHGSYAVDFRHPTNIEVVQAPGHRASTVSTWKNGHESAVQVYWKINGLGHAWSGGSPEGSFTYPHGPDASLAMYRFFMDHPMDGSER